MKLKIFLFLLSMVVIGITARFAFPDRDSLHIDSSGKQCGVCWVGGRTVITKKELEPLTKNSISWISQTPFAWQSSSTDPVIRMNTNSARTWWGESDEGIAVTSQLAKKENIRTLLKPHLWVRGGWPGDIKMTDKEDWQEWFSNYKKFIIHYAELAEANQIEILCIGTELSKTTSHEVEWRHLIREIRKIYSGKLTYAANFYEEYEQMKFWNDLDFIGIQAYFPLSEKRNPTKEELKINWTQHLKSIERVQKKFNKPVLFTEIGYKSTEDAAVEPWKWPQESRDAVSSGEMQAKCYEAFFQSAWKKDWLAGAYFWKWYPYETHELHEIDFTPQGKLAERVLFENFKSDHD